MNNKFRINTRTHCMNNPNLRGVNLEEDFALGATN